MHFHSNPKKSGLSATPAVQMVALASEEGSGEGEATPLSSEESNSGESYEAGQEDTTISQGDVEIAVRVAQPSEAFTANASDVIRWDIDSVMRNVKCLTPNF